MYEKKVDDLEFQITKYVYELFHDCNLMPDYSFSTKNLLKMEKGKQVGEFGVSEIIESISKVSNNLYKYEVDFFEPSLYSFFQYENSSGLKYNMFLQDLLITLQKQYSNLDKDISLLIEKTNRIDPTFTLIHGDLHYGNIVKIDNELLLIDWEYFSTGDPQLEISHFLLHYAVHKCLKPEWLFELCKRVGAQKYSFEFDFDIVIYFYIPFLSLVFYDAVHKNKISNNKFDKDKLLSYLNYFNQNLPLNIERNL